MDKRQLIFILMAGVILFNGCIHRQQCIPYEKYNKDEFTAAMNQEYKEYFIAIKKRIYDFARQDHNILEKGEICLYFNVIKDGTI